jgi:hypothetical protein
VIGTLGVLAEVQSHENIGMLPAREEMSQSALLI